MISKILCIDQKFYFQENLNSFYRETVNDNVDEMMFIHYCPLFKKL